MTPGHSSARLGHPSRRGVTGVGDDRVRRAAPRRDLVWGVVLPSVVLGPFVAFGLAVIAVTGVGPAAPSRAAGHGTAMWLVAAMVSGTLHVVALRAAILARPSAVYEKPALRAADTACSTSILE